MRFSHLALAASAASSALATESLCDYYTNALLGSNTPKDQWTVVSLLVNTVAIGNFTGKGTANPTLPGSMNAVPGILAKGTYMGTKVNLLPYFDASLLSTNVNGKAMAVNFLDGGGAAPIIKDPTSFGTKGSNQYFLLSHLVEFFGVLLGCSGYGMGGFSNYLGDPNMASVHQYMDLSEAEFGYFVEQAGLAATSFGVTTSDVKKIASALETTFGMRCSAPAPVVPGAGSLPQAICQASDCPEASSPDCSAYINAMPPKKAGAVATGTGGQPPPTSTITTPPPTSTAGAVVTGVPAAGVLAAAGLVAAFL